MRHLFRLTERKRARLHSTAAHGSRGHPGEEHKKRTVGSSPSGWSLGLIGNDAAGDGCGAAIVLIRRHFRCVVNAGLLHVRVVPRRCGDFFNEVLSPTNNREFGARRRATLQAEPHSPLLNRVGRNGYCICTHGLIMQGPEMNLHLSDGRFIGNSMHRNKSAGSQRVSTRRAVLGSETTDNLATVLKLSSWTYVGNGITSSRSKRMQQPNKRIEHLSGHFLAGVSTHSAVVP
jgi:hypothetical protein